MGVVLGLLAGVVVALIALEFFGEEINRWIDRTVNRVRRALGLKDRS